MAHPYNHNLDKTEKEKVSKYYELSEEFKATYKLKKVLTIPVVVTATGLVSKHLSGYLKQIKLDKKKCLRESINQLYWKLAG